MTTSTGPSCCRLLEKIGRMRSPFSRVVCLDYYDGPLAGMVECSVCSRTYSFNAVALNAFSDVRVYALSEIQAGSIEEVVRAMADYAVPHWPVWVPRWSFPSPAERSRAEESIDAILARAADTGPQYVIATDALERIILGGRAVDGVARRMISNQSKDTSPQGDRVKEWLRVIESGR